MNTFKKLKNSSAGTCIRLEQMEKTKYLHIRKLRTSILSKVIYATILGFKRYVNWILLRNRQAGDKILLEK